MDEPGLKDEIKGKSKAASTEQRTKLRQLQERRIQLQNANVAESSADENQNKKHKKRRLPAATIQEEISGAPASDKHPGDTRSVKEQGHVFQAAEKADTWGIDGATKHPPESSGSEFHHANCDQFLRSATLDKHLPETPTCTKRKRKKLRWGLEIKQRWERKGNM